MASTLAAMVWGVARLAPAPRPAPAVSAGSDALHSRGAASPFSARHAAPALCPSPFLSAAASAPAVLRGSGAPPDRHTSLPHSRGGDAPRVVGAALSAILPPAPVRAVGGSRMCPCVLWRGGG
eukprot:4610780-Pleurochrysis_carterae.AAC.1